VFPNAKYINLIRDGRDVVSSYLKMGRYTSIEDASRRWIQSIRLARKFGKNKEKQYLEVRYENLVSNPSKEVKKMCNFLNINYFNDILNPDERSKLKDVKTHSHYSNVKKPITTKSIGKYKKNLSDSQIKKVEKLLHNELVKLGYET